MKKNSVIIIFGIIVVILICFAVYVVSIDSKPKQVSQASISGNLDTASEKKPIDFVVGEFKFKELLKFADNERFQHDNQTAFFKSEKDNVNGNFLAIIDWEYGQLIININQNFCYLQKEENGNFTNGFYHIKIDNKTEKLIEDSPLEGAVELSGNILIFIEDRLIQTIPYIGFE
jgi:hypothetical protein